MFSFLKLELMNWDLWDHVVVPVDEQVIVVSGPNGSGKTTMLDAIRVLLGSKSLSTSRKLGGYLRSEVKVCVIKALVTNPLRRGHGRRPFTRRGIFEDTATVACIIENKSGAWHRRYHILPGDASIAQIRKQPRGMGPEEYAGELRAAGLPRTLLKILALEQGETHALCRRSPQQLLDYVLEMQGDKAVLDAYEVARQNYALSREEHKAQETNAREAERQLELTARDARSYEDYRRIQRDIRDIETRRFPAAQWHERRRVAEALARDKEEAQAAVDRFDSENADRIQRTVKLEREITDLATSIGERKRQRGTKLKDKESVDGRAREVRVRLKQLIALRDQAAKAPEGDVEALERSARAALLAEADAERRMSELRARKAEVEQELAGLQTGSRPRLPRFVGDMASALRRAHIEHSMVVDVIDVVVARWQKAVESVLGRDRFTVLVDAKDALAAREVASSCRYPAYVASLEHSNSIDAPVRSALSAVELREARLPRWLVQRLADVRLVDSVEDGFRMARDGATITADGYRQDRRGGVYVGVDTLYCGGGAGEAHTARLQKELATAKETELTIHRSRREAIGRRATAQKELDVLAAKDRWEEAREECAALEAEDKTLIEEKRARATAIMDLIGEAEDMTRALAEREAELRRIRHEGGLVDEERRRRLVRMHELTSRHRMVTAEVEELGASVPEELRSEAAGELLESTAELGGRIGVMKERLDGYEGCRDPAILEVLARQQVNLEEQLGLLRIREAELREGEEELGQARRSYVRVAEATVDRYAQALRVLSERAGLDVEVRFPRLTHDDDAIERAGLEVRLGFDGKRPVRISDPRLSGGQKVLASLMLLVALTFEGEEEAGGFFILDEPFAHLSVERIDHVARFMGGTRSQFLLTTPTTHNFAVFNSAQMVLTLRKKKPEMAAAPAPMYVRR